MTGLEVVLAIAGTVVFLMVILGMFLIVPGGAVELGEETADPVRERAAEKV